MTIRIISLLISLTVLAAAVSSCTYSMCHPYKLSGLCEYVGADGIPTE